MIHIVGLILKIIGIVLALLLLFLLLCVLFVVCIPASYHGSVRVKEETEIKLVMNGPLWFYRLKVGIKDGKTTYKFRILGIPVLKNAEAEKTKKKTPNKKKKNRPEGFLEKIKYTFHNFCVKIKMIWNNSKELKTLLEKDVTREAFSDLKKELGIFLKIFRPRKLKGYVEFGTGDPASTGQILGAISIFYFACFPQIALYPFFEERCFRTELIVKGRLSFLKVLGCLVRLYGNRKIKYVYKKIKNLGGAKHVGEE